MRPQSHYLAFLDTRIAQGDCAALAHMVLDRLMEGAGARGILDATPVQPDHCPTEESPTLADRQIVVDGHTYTVRVFETS